MNIYTIGYEGTDLEAFMTVLHKAGVRVVADLRAVAISRRKGFSKTALSERLKEAGIGYAHFRELGDPKPGREAARAGRMREFERIYSAHLRTFEAKAELEELTTLAGRTSVALLCYEADPLGCHRLMVAREIVKSQKSSMVHLGVNHQGLPIGSRTRDYSREGLAAA